MTTTDRSAAASRTEGEAVLRLLEGHLRASGRDPDARAAEAIALGVSLLAVVASLRESGDGEVESELRRLAGGWGASRADALAWLAASGLHPEDTVGSALRRLVDDVDRALRPEDGDGASGLREDRLLLDAEVALVRALGARIGYGRVMQLCEALRSEVEWGGSSQEPNPLAVALRERDEARASLVDVVWELDQIRHPLGVFPENPARPAGPGASASERVLALGNQARETLDSLRETSGALGEAKRSLRTLVDVARALDAAGVPGGEAETRAGDRWSVDLRVRWLSERRLDAAEAAEIERGLSVAAGSGDVDADVFRVLATSVRRAVAPARISRVFDTGRPRLGGSR
jgi:hypothetical protein